MKDFLDPARLWWLLAVGGLAALYVGAQFVRRRHTVRFTNVALLDAVAPRRPGWRRHAVAVVHLLALAALVVAAARPVSVVRVPRQRATIMLALDTSLSMKATDVDPSRIEGAKAAAKKFVRSIPAKINVGLVSFDTGARLNVAPTTNHTAVTTAIAGLKLHEGTSIGDAVDISLEAIDRIPETASGKRPPAVIVLLSDGSTTVGKRTEDAIPDARKAKVPVWTIAYGTPDGSITVTDPNTGSPTQVPVPVDAEALANLSSQTGASSFRAESTGDLSEVYQKLGSSIGYDNAKREVTDRWVIGALIGFLLASGLSLAWFQRIP